MNLRSLLCILLITLFLLTSGCLDSGFETLENIARDKLPGVENISSSESSNINESDFDYRQRMRNFVINISNYSKEQNPDFIIVPQNGQELLTFGGSPDILLSHEYVEAIDGVGREDLFFGFDEDNSPTENAETEQMVSLLDIARNDGVVVMVTDYCWDLSYVDTSYRKNEERGYISFAAESRELNSIPENPAEPFNANNDDIGSLPDARNFVYIINPGEFESKEAFLEVLQQTDYDVILIDLFYNETALTAENITSLKTKANGGSRLVLAYMSIGEAEDYHYYWDNSWTVGSPEWIEAENPDWEGNYKVRYWDKEWHDIIYGNEDAYLDMVMDAGFDGVYLDIIDAFEYFEGQ